MPGICVLRKQLTPLSNPLRQGERGQYAAIPLVGAGTMGSKTPKPLNRLYDLRPISLRIKELGRITHETV